MERLALIRAQLANNALAVCQTYLPNGWRHGQYWVVGDIDGHKGRSLYIRLSGRAGKWTDSATGDYGDLLDIIRHKMGLHSFGDTLAEAERFLSRQGTQALHTTWDAPSSDRSEMARRLFQSAGPLKGTLAARYLERRGLIDCHQYDALRFHPQCYGRSDSGEHFSYPALLAAITDFQGSIHGVHRTWLACQEPAKAPISAPKRSLGSMIGHGVRFGKAHDALIVGEGLETVLTLKTLCPWMASLAALTATHLGLLELPEALQRLYIARDNDAAGSAAWIKLSERARSIGITPMPLIPQHKDWNEDLLILGFANTLQQALRQLATCDRG